MLKRGATLVELLVALTLGALVMGAATISMLRQQKNATRVRATSETDLQLTAATRVIGDQLSALEQAADLAAGEASDTALQFRAPIVASLACTASSGMVTIAGDTATVPVAGSAASPKAGDSLWWRGDSLWNGTLITAVSSSSITCSNPITRLSATQKLTLARPDTVPVAAALRVTRQTRYALYKASDGTWQLGFRESTGIPARFAAPQPVIGPLIPTLGSRRTGFRYFDDADNELLPGGGSAPTARIARIRLTSFAILGAHSAGQDSVRADSIDVALRHATGP